MNLYLVQTMDEVLKQALDGQLTPIAPTPDAVEVEVDDDASDAITH
jgi:hypothetical protein